VFWSWRVIVVAVLAFVALVVPQAASATITGTAFMDYNSNGAVGVGAFTAGTGVTATDVGASRYTRNAIGNTCTGFPVIPLSVRLHGPSENEKGPASPRGDGARLRAA
jgi:hypothetical protein